MRQVTRSYARHAYYCLPADPKQHTKRRPALIIRTQPAQLRVLHLHGDTGASSLGCPVLHRNIHDQSFRPPADPLKLGEGRVLTVYLEYYSGLTCVSACRQGRRRIPLYLYMYTEQITCCGYGRAMLLEVMTI